MGLEIGLGWARARVRVRVRVIDPYLFRERRGR